MTSQTLTPARRGALPELDSRTELAILARALFREGYDDHDVGHITVRHSDDTFLTLPGHLGWNEIRSEDVLLVDGDGNVLEGDGWVVPALVLHLELHRARSDCGVVVHQHPEYATVYAAAGRLPPAYDQLGALVDDSDVAVYDDFVGPVTLIEAAQANVRAMKDCDYALLANHGVVVIGEDVNEAYFRSVILEARCRLAWRVEAIGGGRPMPEAGRAALFESVRKAGGRPPSLWGWAVRREVRNCPSLCDANTRRLLGLSEEPVSGGTGRGAF